jgi:hypothetical protein
MVAFHLAPRWSVVDDGPLKDAHVAADHAEVVLHHEVDRDLVVWEDHGRHQRLCPGPRTGLAEAQGGRLAAGSAQQAPILFDIHTLVVQRQKNNRKLPWPLRIFITSQYFISRLYIMPSSYILI